MERGRFAHLFVGSANATGAGLGQNVEFLCELIAPVKTLGVDTLVGDDARFRKMLTPYAPSEPEPDGEAAVAGRALEGLLLDIAGGSPFRTVVTGELDGWTSRVTADAALPHFPEVVDVTIAPHNRQAETYPIRPAEPVDIALPARDLADLTPFLRLTVRRTVEGVVLERSTVVCSRLEGAPGERFDQILARQIDTPEKFLRLLALLIGFVSRGGDEVAVAGNGSGSWAAGTGQGVLELLAARAVREPRVDRPFGDDRRAAASVGQRERPYSPRDGMTSGSQLSRRDARCPRAARDRAAPGRPGSTERLPARDGGACVPPAVSRRGHLPALPRCR